VIERLGVQKVVRRRFSAYLQRTCARRHSTGRRQKGVGSRSADRAFAQHALSPFVHTNSHSHQSLSQLGNRFEKLLLSGVCEAPLLHFCWRMRRSFFTRRFVFFLLAREKLICFIVVWCVYVKLPADWNFYIHLTRLTVSERVASEG
jgi:hypothetical protein